MDNRLLALLEPPKVGTLRKLYRSYFGQPTGKHALTAPSFSTRTTTAPYTMPDALRYRVRAAALRSALPLEVTTNERLGLPTPEDTSEPAGVCSG